MYHKVKKSVKQFVQYGFSFDLKLCVCIHMHRKNSKIYQQNWTANGLEIGSLSGKTVVAVCEANSSNYKPVAYGTSILNIG